MGAAVECGCGGGEAPAGDIPQGGASTWRAGARGGSRERKGRRGSSATDSALVTVPATSLREGSAGREPVSLGALSALQFPSHLA